MTTSTRPSLAVISALDEPIAFVGVAKTTLAEAPVAEPFDAVAEVANMLDGITAKSTRTELGEVLRQVRCSTNPDLLTAKTAAMCLRKVSHLVASNEKEFGFFAWSEGYVHDLGALIREAADEDLRLAYEVAISMSRHPIELRDTISIAQFGCLQGLIRDLKKEPDFKEILLELSSKVPGFLAHLPGPWEHGAVITKDMADTATNSIERFAYAPDTTHALRGLALDRLASIRRLFDLDWMPPREAMTELRVRFSWDRAVRFKGADDEHFKLILEKAVENLAGLGNPLAHISLNYQQFQKRLREIAGFSERIQQFDLIKDFFTIAAPRLSLYGHQVPMRAMRFIADAHKPEVASKMLIAAAASAKDGLLAAPSVDAGFVVRNFAHFCASIVHRQDPLDAGARYRNVADAKEVHKLILSIDWESLAVDIPTLDVDFRVAERKATMDSRSAVRAVRFAFVEAGVIELSRLPKKDLTMANLGPILLRSPKRLAEVTDLESFKRLARQARIPVRIPSEATATSATSAPAPSKGAAENGPEIAACMRRQIEEVSQSPAAQLQVFGRVRRALKP
ncbi:hypothetical protein [Paucibacter soli]|uniref:hypothetical protein n=1 Tax=Paucibacter soli TaxID=3133433 RepID=UPI00309E21D3